MKHYDLVVIGSGPAGQKGAERAAKLGKRVAIIERQARVGGSGLSTGTVPSKTLREAALYYSGLRQRGLFGIEYSLKANMSVADFMQREKIVVDNEYRLIEENITRQDITLVHGDASFKDANRVVIASGASEKELHADVILIATGSIPQLPSEIPIDGNLTHDSDSILKMDRIPRTMAVVGGGVVGTEYASLFTALGVNVILIEPRERLLPFVDTEMIHRLSEQLGQAGLKFALGDQVLSVTPDGKRVQLNLKSLGVVDVDVVLVATGRRSNIESLGLEKVGVQLDKHGFIQVDEKYQTSVENIYAAGDVIGFPALASASMEQARVAMTHAFDPDFKAAASPIIPLALYTIPEISLVGMTEDECRSKDISHLIGRAYYKNNPRGQIIGDMSGMVKLIFSPQDRKLLGAHIIGEQASELIHIAAQLMFENGTIDVLAHLVYNYPTLAELYKHAAMDGLKQLHSQES